MEQGGQVKRDGWLASLSGVKIQSIDDFVTVLNKKKGKINVNVDVSQIEGVKELLDKRWDHIESIPNTHKMHYMKVVDKYIIERAINFTKHYFKPEENERG